MNEQRCGLCGKVLGDHHDGDFCDPEHGHEEDESRRFTPEAPSKPDEMGDALASIGIVPGEGDDEPTVRKWVVMGDPPIACDTLSEAFQEVLKRLRKLEVEGNGHEHP